MAKLVPEIDCKKCSPKLPIKGGLWSMSHVIIVARVGCQQWLLVESMETLKGEGEKSWKMKFLDKCADFNYEHCRSWYS